MGIAWQVKGIQQSGALLEIQDKGGKRNEESEAWEVASGWER